MTEIQMTSSTSRTGSLTAWSASSSRACSAPKLNARGESVRTISTLMTFTFERYLTPRRADRRTPLSRSNFLEEALTLDPDYVAARALIAWCHEKCFARSGLKEVDRVRAISHAHWVIGSTTDDAAAPSSLGTSLAS